MFPSDGNFVDGVDIEMTLSAKPFGASTVVQKHTTIIQSSKQPTQYVLIPEDFQKYKVKHRLPSMH